jgi:hypothetical protein
MTVELAVCLPVILALIGITLNVLAYLNVCARFDRIAPDAVRSQAASPGYGQEGSALAASRICETIERSFNAGTSDGIICEIAVSATAVGLGGESATGSDGISFSSLCQLERYDCQITYHPWPLNKIVFLQFFEVTHTRSYTVDTFKPGVLF